jgi:hypothetical protein
LDLNYEKVSILSKTDFGALANGGISLIANN